MKIMFPDKPPILVCDICGFNMPGDAFMSEHHFSLCDDCLAALKEMVTERRKGKEPFKNISSKQKKQKP